MHSGRPASWFIVFKPSTWRRRPAQHTTSVDGAVQAFPSTEPCGSGTERHRQTTQARPHRDIGAYSLDDIVRSAQEASAWAEILKLELDRRLIKAVAESNRLATQHHSDEQRRLAESDKLATRLWWLTVVTTLLTVVQALTGLYEAFLNGPTG
jgi:hypothetical protein